MSTITTCSIHELNFLTFATFNNWSITLSEVFYNLRSYELGQGISLFCGVIFPINSEVLVTIITFIIIIRVRRISGLIRTGLVQNNKCMFTIAIDTYTASTMA